jgi:hypothetical protein
LNWLFLEYLPAFWFCRSGQWPFTISVTFSARQGSSVTRVKYFKVLSPENEAGRKIYGALTFNPNSN